MYFLGNTLFTRIHRHAVIYETEVLPHAVILSPNCQKTMITKKKWFSYIKQYAVRPKPQIRTFLTHDHVGKLCQNWPKFELFGLLFKFELLNFSDFAYFNRQTWFLNDNGRLVTEKNFRVKFGPCLDLSPI